MNLDGVWEFCDDIDPDPLHFHKAPYGQIGDSLWVRETWATSENFDHIKPSELSERTSIVYRANEPYAQGYKWRPSIFMPRWASRLTLKLEIVSIRIERLQGISSEDAKKEGLDSFTSNLGASNSSPVRFYRVSEFDEGGYGSPVEAFKDLWDSINGKRGFGWEKNPWVWVVEFETTRK